MNRTRIAVHVAAVAIFAGAACQANSAPSPQDASAAPGVQSKASCVKAVADLPQNMISIPGKSYKMCRYEVTQALWEAVMGNNPSSFKNPDNPVENVSWYDCQEFIKKLNEMPVAKDSGLSFRLPTEEEWEYACRAGSTGKYCRLSDGTEITDENLGDVAWYVENSEKRPHPVGQKKPNAFGMYDMHGSMWEWTQTAEGKKRIPRGGSWLYSGKYCASSYRNKDSPSFRCSRLGFRLCASPRAEQ